MQWLDHLSSWLLHAAVFGAILLSLGGLAVWLCREPVYRIRIIRWTFVACLIVPAVQQLGLIPFYSLSLSRSDQDRSEARRSEAPEFAVASTPAPIDPPAAPSPFSETGFPAVTDGGLPGDPMQAAPSSAGEEQVASSTLGMVFDFAVLQRWVVVLYGAFVLGLLVRWAIAWRHRNGIARRARLAEARLRSILSSIGGAATDRARLLVSDEIDSPLMWGLWRPTIVIPTSLTRDSESVRLRWGLAHEWSHVRRRDFGIVLLAMVTRTVCFYQPAYWWLRRQLALSQDFLADAFAADQGESPEDYADFLVALARTRVSPEGSVTLGIGDRQSNLLRRIRMLVQSTRPILQQVGRAPALAITLVALMTVGGLSAVRLGAQPADSVAAAADQSGVANPAQEPAAKPVENNPKPVAAKQELPEPITYEGRVVRGDTDEPVPQAVVEVTHQLSRDPKTQKWITLRVTKHPCDAMGRYSFTLPPEEVAEPSLYLVVEAHHPDYQSKGRSGYSHTMIRRNLANGEPPFYSKIKLFPGKPLTATVLLPDGTPAKKTKVLAYTKAPSKEPGMSFERGAFQESQTDEQGRLRVIVATPGDGVLWIYHPDAAPLAHRIGDKRGELGELKLSEGTRVSGQVFDASGNPLAGVGFALRRKGDNEAADEFLNANAVSNGIRGGARTDAQGRFTTNPLPPGEYQARISGSYRDPTATHQPRVPQQQELPHVFAPQTITIDSEQPLDPIEIRAAPHLLVRGRFFDSEGKPRASHQQFLFGKVDGNFFQARSTRPQSDGWFEFRVPHGIEEVRLNFMTNEHSALRWRFKPDSPWHHGRQGDLGKLEQDLTTLEIIRYKAPILLVKVEDEDGALIRDFELQSRYETKMQDEMDGAFSMSRSGHVGFEKQPDGRHRSRQMLPDEETSVTVSKEGYASATEKVTLKEGEEREIRLVLKELPEGVAEEVGSGSFPPAEPLTQESNK